jgi:hypothetical protein
MWHCAKTLHLELYKETALFLNPLITIAASRHLGLNKLLVCFVVHTVVFLFVECTAVHDDNASTASHFANDHGCKVICEYRRRQCVETII